MTCTLFFITPVMRESYNATAKHRSNEQRTAIPTRFRFPQKADENSNPMFAKGKPDSDMPL